jgi:pre-rRNA-processing protein TSR4
MLLLGLPGPWAEEPNEVADHYTSKIGGTPDWPVPLHKINLDMLKCTICGNYLALVAQVDSSYHIFHFSVLSLFSFFL